MDEYRKISAEEAKNMMNEDCIILDVRMDYEYESGHIPGAILLPVQDVEDKAEQILKEKNKKILIYCRTGHRSKKAADKLIKKGYTSIFDFGGINEWPYEIIH